MAADELIIAKGGKGAGIRAEYGNSWVKRLEIQTGDGRAESVLGAGIRSGNASVNDQRSQIDTIQVRGGKVTADSLNGSGQFSRHVEPCI
jgi:hypothetical protein